MSAGSRRSVVRATVGRRAQPVALMNATTSLNSVSAAGRRFQRKGQRARLTKDASFEIKRTAAEKVALLVRGCTRQLLEATDDAGECFPATGSMSRTTLDEQRQGTLNPNLTQPNPNPTPNRCVHVVVEDRNSRWRKVPAVGRFVGGVPQQLGKGASHGAEIELRSGHPRPFTTHPKIFHVSTL